MLKRVRLRIQSWWARRFYHIDGVVCPNCHWAGSVRVTKGTPLKHAVVACPACGVESCCRDIGPEAVRVPAQPVTPGMVTILPGQAAIRLIREKPGLLYDPKTKVFLKRYDATTV